MGVIRQLPKDVIERIAAGEVVARPASVVKELVENAVDAGSTAISIDVACGGKKRITVADDGCGMGPEDLKSCALRHTTSKIARESDLWNISTMGFRGEALAAMGAVSRLVIESKLNRPEVIEGYRIEVEGGRITGPSVAGSAGGTRVTVSDLFFNVPARRKFLRSDAVEYGHIAGLVNTYALGFPHIRFELTSEGKGRFKAAAASELGRITAVLGDEVAKTLVPVKGEGPGLSLTGWVGEKGRTQGKDVHFFLNRRPVRDRMLLHAITSAFDQRLTSGQFPAAVLWMEMDPTKVDVNVHPAKREVRFSESGAVHDFVMSAVRKAVAIPATSFPITGTKSSAGRCESPFDAETKCRSGVEVAIDRYERSRLGFEKEGWKSDFRTPSPIPLPSGERVGVRGGLVSDPLSLVPDTETSMRPLGQLGSAYVVCEDSDSTLVLIDQHAAHERLGFEHLRSQYASGKLSQQRLLIPERVDLGARELGYVVDHLELLTKAGFEIEPFGGKTLLVKAVPGLLGARNLTPLFEQLAQELEEIGTSSSIDKALDRIFSTVACHSQVRAGDRLSPEEMTSLVRDIQREEITHCPHGRPAVVRIEKVEIEKWFKRR